MKKTFWKDLFKTILRSKVTFFSIVIFIMMGMLLFLGIDWTASCVVNNTIDYYNSSNVFDIQINVSPGYKNPEELLNIEEVDEVEGLYNYITSFKDENNGFEASFTSIPEKINYFSNINGTLPENEGEIALISFWAEDNGYEIGDTIKIENTPVFLDQGRFTTDTFKVTAIVDSAILTAKKTTVYGMSPTRNIPVNAPFFIAESSFNPTINNLAGFNTIYVRSNTLRNYKYFTEDFYSKTEDIVKTIKASSELEGKSFSVSTIRDSISHQNIQTISEVLGQIKYSMSLLFVGVGLLVSFFSMSRMVNETQQIIGVKKAKGFRNREIYAFYLIYTGIAVVFGAILGAILGRFAAEPIIVNAVANAIIFPPLKYEFAIGMTLIVFAIELVSQLLITLFATHKVLKKKPIELIRDEKIVLGKKRFYQKGKLWNKLSLFTKTVINNFATDKTRVFSMLVGIIGCAGLLTCALTIDRNISGSFDYQFKNVYSFQAVVHYDGDASSTKTKLDGTEYRYTDVMFTYLTLECPNGKRISSQAYVFDDPNKANDFITMYNKSGEKINFGNDFYLSYSYQEKFDVKENDKVTLMDTSLKSVEVTNTNFFKHYLINNVVVCSADTLKDTFGTEFKSNALLVDLKGDDISNLSKLVIQDAPVSYIYDVYNVSMNAFNSVTSIFKIVDIVYLVLALIMALLVILDLLVMFINEKKNELTILIINGYSKRKAKKYIYSDTIVLSIVGIGLGVLFGTLMSNFVIRGFQSESIIFLSGFNFISILIAIGIAIAIITGVTLIALRKIDKFKLRDINKLG